MHGSSVSVFCVEWVSGCVAEWLCEYYVPEAQAGVCLCVYLWTVCIYCWACR